jgi:hypothetical protein
MSAPDRRQLADRKGGVLSIRRQCTLLAIARSGLYRPPSAANDNGLARTRRIDEPFTALAVLAWRPSNTARCLYRKSDSAAAPRASTHSSGPDITI